MFSRKLFTMLIAAFLLTATSLAYAVKPGDKPPPSEDVEDAIKQLQAMTRAFHGYKVFERNSGGSGSSVGEVEFFIQALIVSCPEGSFGEGTSYEFCDDNVPEAYVLNTGDIYPDVYGLVITFDSDNTVDFDAVVEQLTNGNGDDGLTLADRRCVVEQSGCGGGSSYGSEFSFLNSYNTIAPVAGRVDWVGLDIGSISVRINQFTESYDSNDDRTEYDFDYDVFFETPID